MFRILQNSILILLTGLVLINVVMAEGNITKSKWWSRMEQEAKQSGYHLISTQDAQKWYEHHETFIAIDVRPDYEYEEEHLLKALNVEFDLGTRNKISQKKKKQFLKTLGEDKSVKILIYCRSHSWIRSELAANWAVRLGYKNVYRMPTGFFGWKKDILKHDDLVNNDQMLGKYFPECQFVSINRTQDYLYLGIDQSARKIRLTDIRSQFIYVSLFNEMCSQCVEEIKQYGLLYKFFQHDAKFKNTVKIIGIGAGSSHRGVKKFIKHHNIPYPVFVDKNWDIFKCLGEPPLPVAYLLKKESGSKIKIVSIRNEHIESIADVLKEIGSIIY